jgi:hypothetical protein
MKLSTLFPQDELIQLTRTKHAALISISYYKHSYNLPIIATKVHHHQLVTQIVMLPLQSYWIQF